MHHAIKGASHILDFFVNVSEENPIIGLMSLLAYAYGGGAVLAPEFLKSILIKLHAQGLISGIKPAQELGKWLSHGEFSEAISVAVTYWQAMVIGGNFDQFVIKAISVLREDPAQVAVIISLAIGMGYGLCKVIPALEKEMGDFPWYNDFFLGIKILTLGLDIAINAGNDWLFGSIKWLMLAANIILQLLISPFIEWSLFGFNNGFLSGLKKSGFLLINTLRQITAALLDLGFYLLTLPLVEGYALLIHVPFRGITSLLSKTLTAFGQWGILGETLLNFAYRPQSWNYFSHFRLSPLYGFNISTAIYLNNLLLNKVINFSINFLKIGLQLIKNVLILPAIDLSSLTIRLALSVLNLASRFCALISGFFFLGVGSLWDPSIGILLRFTGYSVTFSANIVNDILELCRCHLLKQVQIARKAIYFWGFGAENDRLQATQTDLDYFKEDPIRIRRLPKDSTSTIFNFLLPPRRAASENPIGFFNKEQLRLERIKSMPPNITALELDKTTIAVEQDISYKS